VKAATQAVRLSGLGERLTALGEVVTLAGGRLEPGPVEAAHAVLERAGSRLRLNPEATVVALAGGTGSGKSSLFNALVGEELSAVGVRRPTTARPVACSWGGEGAGELLDWLGAWRRHHVAAPRQDLDGLVLVDLPDHDSTLLDHRLEVDRLVALVDMLVWVLDPQKYADALLHDRYLRPLAGHASVLMFVLNHADSLDADARRACVADLQRLLAQDGLGTVPVLVTSALTGEGIAELEERLIARVARRRAALERIAADLVAVASRLDAGCTGTPHPPAGAQRRALVSALAEAASVQTVVNAVARAHKHRSTLAVGWPFTRWVRKFRPDPLARWRLGSADATQRSSLALPGPVQLAQVTTAVRAVAQEVAGHLPDPWPRRVRSAAAAGEESLPDLLEEAVSAADLGMSRRPRWWRVAALLQVVMGLAAIAGALWLAVLFGIAWLQLPDPPVPEVEGLPLPTVLLLGGMASGLVLAWVGRAVAAAGARRRARAARRRLLNKITAVAQEHVVEPMNAELEARDRLCRALARVAGG
jgi:GTP-binding protein EngB required for normal cell division